MSGFSAHWLALREPIDHAVRNEDVLKKVAEYFSQHTHLRILDLGCGTGSNLRGLAMHLHAQEQTWTLIDHDPVLLESAKAALSVWGDHATHTPDSLKIIKADKTIKVIFQQADLNRDLNRILDASEADGDYQLVTAAALFDLISEVWVQKFVEQLKLRKLPFYTSLTYNGVEEWLPNHSFDKEIHTAFQVCMQSDKGFGAAMGGDAAPIMAQLFENSGYKTFSGLSPWLLNAHAHEALINMLKSGIMQACEQHISGHTLNGNSSLTLDMLKIWENLKHESATIGHDDLWAII